MKHNRRALFAALTSSALLFGFGSCMPFWEYATVKNEHASVPGSTSWFVLYEPHSTSLWGWLTLRDTDREMVVETYRKENLRSLAILTMVTVLGGLGVFWTYARTPRSAEASDYGDGPAGAVLDGRLK